MNSWKDAACVAIGFALLVAGPYYAFSGVNTSSSVGSHSAYPSGTLFPSCDYFPDGKDGKPCVDSAEFQKTGTLHFYQHYPN